MKCIGPMSSRRSTVARAHSRGTFPTHSCGIRSGAAISDAPVTRVLRALVWWRVCHARPARAGWLPAVRRCPTLRADPRSAATGGVRRTNTAGSEALPRSSAPSARQLYDRHPDPHRRFAGLPSSLTSRTTWDRSSRAKVPRSRFLSAFTRRWRERGRTAATGERARAQSGDGHRVSCLEWFRASRRTRLRPPRALLHHRQPAREDSILLAVDVAHGATVGASRLPMDQLPQSSGSRLGQISRDSRRFERFETFGSQGGGGLLRSHVVYERSPEFLSVMTEALFRASGRPRLAGSRA